MGDFLQQMAKSSAERASRIAQTVTAAELDQPVFPLRLQGFDIIAEIKDRSPAEGELAAGEGRRAERAAQYARGGATAISVLTEPSRFAGAVEHLQEVASTVASRQVPVMCKDFLVAPVQILQARAAGASGVLLVTAILSDDQLAGMLDCAYEHGMFVLLESFDEQDLRRAAGLLDADTHLQQARAANLLFGVNSRNLRTLVVDEQRLQKLASLLPRTVSSVAESGLHTAADAGSAASLGYDMALVGTALMRSAAPQQLLREMLDAGRRQVAA